MQELHKVPIAVLDFEMTGLDPQRDRVCEVAIVRGTFAGVEEEYQTLVRPDVKVSRGARRVHGITDNILRRAPKFKRVAPKVVELLQGAVLVCHNVPFDIGFLHRELHEAGMDFEPPVTIDTLLMARRLFAFPRNNLATVCERLDVPLLDAHRALGDARATFQVYSAMIDILSPDGTATVADLLDLLGSLAPDSPMRLRQKRTLRRAFRDRRTVTIDYQATHDPRVGLVHREIALWALRLPYMQAWCYLRDGERIFRLDRIREVVPAERSYEIPEFKKRI